MKINMIIVLNLLLIALVGETALAKCPQKLYTCKGKVISNIASSEVDGVVSLFINDVEKPVASAQISKTGEYVIKFRFDSFRRLIGFYHDCHNVPERLTFIVTSEKNNGILRKQFEFKSLTMSENNEIIIPEFILERDSMSPPPAD